MNALYVPALLVAFLLTLLELTEVVVLVFALGADQPGIRHGAVGAASGTGVVAAFALGAGALLLAFPRGDLLLGSAVVLAAFGGFLFRSTLRTYRRQRAAAQSGTSPSPPRPVAQFAGGFSVGAVEATEAVVVLLALTAAGYGTSALVGALAAGGVLAVATALVHEKVRRIKTAWLKLGGTSLLFTFAVFWAGEAYRIPWPGTDLFLVPLFIASAAAVRGFLELALRRRDRRSTPAT